MSGTLPSGVYRYPKMERVVFGRPLMEALKGEVEERGAKRVFLIASGTLAQAADLLGRLRESLHERLVGHWTKIGAHTPRVDVVAAAAAAREAKADLVLTIGGGSVTDAGKMVRLCLANGVTAPAELGRFRTKISPDGKRDYPTVAPADRPLVAVPTTLSAGEYSAFAGCTDTEKRVKQSFAEPMMAPNAVLLDPALTLHTPEWLWLSTGIRAVDHAVEDLCSTNGTPLSDGASLHALRLLASGLRRSKAEPRDLAARLDCLTGAWLSMVGSQSGVDKGASHGIGHVLGGTAGVPHGYTSCVMMPPVMRFNAPVVGARQKLIAEAVGRPEMEPAAAIAELIAGLGLPTRLQDVGVTREQLDEIARLSMHDRWIPTNPRRIEGPETVKMLLEQAW